MDKLGDRIKEIRLKEGMSQEAFARELGYTSKSTINKIEKGINEISYDKLMILIEKYKLTLNQVLEKNKTIVSNPIKKESNVYISFSARNEGNSEIIAKYLMNEQDSLIKFKDLLYNSCNNCQYECLNLNRCKYRNDDIYSLLDKVISYNKIVYIVPMYCGNPSSLYFILSERMQDYFNNNESKYEDFINKLHIIGIFGSKEESPLFIPLLSSWFENDDKILGIERHKINSKINDNIIDDMSIKKELDTYKIKWEL